MTLPDRLNYAIYHAVIAQREVEEISAEHALITAAIEDLWKVLKLVERKG